MQKNDEVRIKPNENLSKNKIEHIALFRISRQYSFEIVMECKSGFIH